MSLLDAIARVSQLQELSGQVATPAAARPADAAERTVAAEPAGSAFTNVLQQAFTTALEQAPAPTVPTTGLPSQTGAGSRALAWAQSQVGQTEQPPGSNDGPAVAAYRSAVAGAQPGQPWCAYFVSWAAAQAGSPLGDTGQGIGYVDGIRDWAGRTGRLLPAGTVPQAGDLVLFGSRHVGMVESVAPDGTLTTVEGNEGSAVTRRTRSPLEPTGFVRL